jgi:hypothetical protein
MINIRAKRFINRMINIWATRFISNIHMHPMRLEPMTSPSSPPCSYTGRTEEVPFELELIGITIPG